MKTFLQSLIGFFFAFSTNLVEAKNQICDKSAKVTAFTQVKDEKSYLYLDPTEIKKSKAFVVAHDFLQVLGKPEGAYTCVVYRNYNGYGGKQKFGWVLTSSLHPARVKLGRNDLFASWNKSPCSDDSCVVNIAEEKGQVEVDMSSYLHNHPGESYQAEKIEESEGHWVLTKLEGSSGAPKKMEIEFGKTEEPGTILLIGPEGWAGTYHR